jgi:hypothetical protein
LIIGLHGKGAKGAERLEISPQSHRVRTENRDLIKRSTEILQLAHKVCFIEKKCFMKTIYIAEPLRRERGAVGIGDEAIRIFPSEWEIASQKPLAMTHMTEFTYVPQ